MEVATRRDYASGRDTTSKVAKKETLGPRHKLADG